MNFDYNYTPSPTFKQFHKDGLDIECMQFDEKGVMIHPGRNYIRCVMGPIGSGKTVGCVNELFLQAITQWKNPNTVVVKDPFTRKPMTFTNTRLSRIAIVRDTLKNLEQTTFETLTQWFPEGTFTKVTKTPHLMYTWDFKLADDDNVHVDMIPICADDKNKALEDLKSLELSGAFVNECVAIDETVINMLIGRVGRFPGGLVDPEKKTKSFIIMDTNPPALGNWYQRYKDEVKPKGWKFYDQPPALLSEKDVRTGKYTFTPNVGQRAGIPPAENIDRLKEGWGYYMKTVETANPMYTLVYACMKYGEVGNGTAVYSTYDDLTHCAPTPIFFNKALPLILGFDYGLTPACVFAQYTPYGQLQIIDELFKKGMGMEQFCEMHLMPKLVNEYDLLDGTRIIAVGDPAGNRRADSNETTAMQILHNYNIPVVPCMTNALLARLESVRSFLNSNMGGQPALRLSPKCEILRKGFQGNYRFETFRNDSARLKEEPEKNDYSHLHDALQYVAHRIRFSREYGQSLFSLWGAGDRPLEENPTYGRIDALII